MRRALLILAMVMALTASALWLFAGRNSGWTKTTVEVRKLDEVTGIEGIEQQKRFVPGVDFLGGALAAAGILAGASFIFRKKQTV